MTAKIINIMAAIDYIEQNLGEDLDLQSVSDALHFSKYHLHRSFRETVGMTMHDYIQRRKLTEAAKLLVFSRKSLLDIALIAGYESQQAFTTIFREMYKKTPLQFRENEEFYPLQLKYVLTQTPPKESYSPWTDTITYASEGDIPRWMALVPLVIDGFPGYCEEEYISALRQTIQRHEALMLRDREIIAGVMIFNKSTGTIEFLGIHPQYRKKGIARAFVQKAANELWPEKTISITTFRKGDKADPGYRRALEAMGFGEAELLTEYGYPTQRMVLSAGGRDGEKEYSGDEESGECSKEGLDEC